MNKYLKAFNLYYILPLVTLFLFLAFIIYNFILSLNNYEKKILQCKNFYSLYIPDQFIEELFTLENDKLKIACEDIKKLLIKNHIYESKYLAAILTLKAIDISLINLEKAKTFLYYAQYFSDKYPKYILTNLILAFYNLEPVNIIYNFFLLLYSIFFSCSNFLYFINLILMLLIAIIFVYIIFVISQYLRYRRLILHSINEQDINITLINPLIYYQQNKNFLYKILQNIYVIFLAFIIFYCYFATGFGKYINLMYDVNEFLKNPYEFSIINDISYFKEYVLKLDKILLEKFKDEKISIDFYYYFAALSKIITNNYEIALNYQNKIPNNSFLKLKVNNTNIERMFLNDYDFYYALISPMRSNALFMILVLTNVLFIIITTGIIKKNIVVNDIKAEICECETISCMNCRINIGLCNFCLKPIKSQNQQENIDNIFFKYDKNIIYYFSFLLPGFTFFYFLKFNLGFFYSFTLISILLIELGIKFKLLNFSCSFLLIFPVLYSFYLIHNYYFFSQKDNVTSNEN